MARAAPSTHARSRSRRRGRPCASEDCVVISCEHGGNRIPARYAAFFVGHEHLIDSHRGYDAGALALARDLAEAFTAPLVVSTTTRLLIDLNRSAGHPRLYSPVTRTMPAALRREILERHWQPYRTRVEAIVAGGIASGRRVIHISAHSFTPELDGKLRSADIGLLYDPARRSELALCLTWQSQIASLAPLLKVRRNYPYAGRADGLTAHLRRRFRARDYVGLELEINQSHAARSSRHWRALRRVLIDSLRKSLQSQGNNTGRM